MDRGEMLLVYIIGGLAIFILLFLLFREINNWYWKINERITLQKETNALLAKISSQLGASNIIEEIKIEKISTGKVRTMKMDEWIAFKKNNPDSDDYRIIS